MNAAKEYKPAHGDTKRVRHCIEIESGAEAIYVDDVLMRESDSFYASELASVCENCGCPVLLTEIQFEADQQDYAFEWPGSFTELFDRYGKWFGV